MQVYTEFGLPIISQDEYILPTFDLDQRLDDSMKYMKDPSYPCEPGRVIDLQELVFKVSIASTWLRNAKEMIENPAKF